MNLTPSKSEIAFGTRSSSFGRKSLIWVATLGLATFAVAKVAETISPYKAPATIESRKNNPHLARVTPQNAVLVYVDYNTGLDNVLTTVPGPQFRENVTAFSKLNKIFKMPTVRLGEESGYYGMFYPEIKENVKTNVTAFLRTSPSGYTEDFAKWMKNTGRKNVIIGGISIDNCTLHTSLDLLRAGYNVYVVVDASSTNSKLVEDASLNRLSNAGAVLTSWLSITTELMQDFDSPEGKEVMAMIGQHWGKSTVGTPVDTTPDGAGIAGTGSK